MNGVESKAVDVQTQITLILVHEDRDNREEMQRRYTTQYFPAVDQWVMVTVRGSRSFGRSLPLDAFATFMWRVPHVFLDDGEYLTARRQMFGGHRGKINPMAASPHPGVISLYYFSRPERRAWQCLVFACVSSAYFVCDQPEQFVGQW